MGATTPSSTNLKKLSFLKRKINKSYPLKKMIPQFIIGFKYMVKNAKCHCVFFQPDKQLFV